MTPLVISFPMAETLGWLAFAALFVGCGADDSVSHGSGPDASIDATPPDAGGGDSPLRHDAADAAPDSQASDAGDASSGATLWLDSYDGIHPFLTFDYKVTDVATAAKHADYVWGNNQGNIAAYRASTHPKIALSSYIPFTRDPDNTHTLAYWKGVHPEWVLYQCDQTTPAFEFGDANVPLDISNPAVVDWQVQSYAVPAAAAGYDAIAADNFVLTNAFAACGVFKGGTWTALYTGASDPKYTVDVLGWASAFRQKLHALTPKSLGLIPNFSLGGMSPTDPNVTKLIAAVDGVVDEAGFTQYGSGYPSETSWKDIVTFVELLQSLGKAHFSINEFNTATPANADVQWALASYLMGKEHAAGIFVSGVQQYGADNWRPEYAAAIGTPCGAMQSTQGGYMRLHQKGLSLVNPTTSAVTFTIPPGAWQDLYGAAVTGSVPLAAHTGLVLVETGAPHC